MNHLSMIMEYNKKFVEDKKYEKYITDKYPNKKLVILTCMDTRLVDLLPRAMNLRNGDAKIIRNAGAILTQPFGNIMRSIIVSLYELNAEEVFVVGHLDCGMTGLSAGNIIEKAKKRGVSEETIEILRHSGIDLSRWLTGFDNVTESVMKSVQIIKNHPLLPENTPVHGLVIDPHTGKLEVLVNGYESMESP